MDLVGLQFWRWLNSDVAPDMVNTVEVYDGANWITLWTSGGITDDQWTEQGFNLTAYRSAQNLRFRIGHQRRIGWGARRLELEHRRRRGD